MKHIFTPTDRWEEREGKAVSRGELEAFRRAVAKVVVTLALMALAGAVVSGILYTSLRNTAEALSQQGRLRAATNCTILDRLARGLAIDCRRLPGVTEADLEKAQREVDELLGSGAGG